MKKYLLIISMIVFIGCASTTKINWTEPKQVEITGASDELITFEGDGIKVTADRRGKENIFQSFVNMLMLRGMNTETK